MKILYRFSLGGITKHRIIKITKEFIWFVGNPHWKTDARKDAVFKEKKAEQFFDTFEDAKTRLMTKRLNSIKALEGQLLKAGKDYRAALRYEENDCKFYTDDKAVE